MLEAGRFFFILDSFDEVPEVLDEKENSELIENLSEAIFQFLNGAHESRGILASRNYRRPTSSFRAEAILEIRPFREEQILHHFRSVVHNGDEYVKKLFLTKPHFIPLMRNPFIAALISRYADQNEGVLPESQSRLYRDYIDNRLSACSERIEKAGLQREQIFEASIEIAEAMFGQANYGLEMPVHELKSKLKSFPVESVTDILVFAKLGRISRSNSFGFVHRRFAEYFAVQKLLRNSADIRLDAIPQDSRWRDSMVLYCELAGEEEAKRIATFCSFRCRS